MRGNLTAPSDTQRAHELALAEGFAAGDPSALQHIDEWIDAVLRRHFRSLRDDWEDLRQEIRVRVLHNIRRNRFEGRSSLRTYVHGVARNTGIDAIRARYRRREDEAASSRSIVRVAPFRDDATTARFMTWTILSQLNASQRELLRLVFLDGRSYVEVARQLGIAEGTVKSRVARCKAKLLAGRVAR